jgi:hypothetical protein
MCRGHFLNFQSGFARLTVARIAAGILPNDYPKTVSNGHDCDGKHKQ